MSLATVVDALTAYLGPRLGPGTAVTDARPTQAGELPAVTVCIDEASETLLGVGRSPRGTRRGALSVRDTVNLADPVLVIDDETIPLLSNNRRVLTLAHGQLVKRDGSSDLPFDSEDISVTAPGGAFTIVDREPSGRQILPDPVTGTLRFGVPLPGTGQLTASYHLGSWDVRTIRFSGRLCVQTTAGSPADARPLARQVAALLDARIGGFTNVAPVSWGPLRAAPDGLADALAQVLGYRFDFELEEPSLPSGGGLIRSVAVTSIRDTATENFVVTREGSAE